MTEVLFETLKPLKIKFLFTLRQLKFYSKYLIRIYHISFMIWLSISIIKSTTTKLEYIFEILPFADIDECTENGKICLNGHCMNTPGAYKCLCNKGFQLSPDKAFCLGNLTKYTDYSYSLWNNQHNLACRRLHLMTFLIFYLTNQCQILFWSKD